MGLIGPSRYEKPGCQKRNRAFIHFYWNQSLGKISVPQTHAIIGLISPKPIATCKWSTDFGSRDLRTPEACNSYVENEAEAASDSTRVTGATIGLDGATTVQNGASTAATAARGMKHADIHPK